MANFPPGPFRFRLKQQPNHQSGATEAVHDRLAGSRAVYMSSGRVRNIWFPRLFQFHSCRLVLLTLEFGFEG